MEETAYALDEERYELAQELEDLKHSHGIHATKQRQLETQVQSLTLELQQWADQEQKQLKQLNAVKEQVK